MCVSVLLIHQLSGVCKYLIYIPWYCYLYSVNLYIFILQYRMYLCCIYLYIIYSKYLEVFTRDPSEVAVPRVKGLFCFAIPWGANWRLAESLGRPPCNTFSNTRTVLLSLAFHCFSSCQFAQNRTCQKISRFFFTLSHVSITDPTWIHHTNAYISGFSGKLAYLCLSAISCAVSCRYELPCSIVSVLCSFHP